MASCPLFTTPPVHENDVDCGRANRGLCLGRYSVREDGRNAEGILRVLVRKGLPIFSSPDLGCVTGRLFRGDCFITEAPLGGDWWSVGKYQWLHGTPGGESGLEWHPSSDSDQYRRLLPRVYDWYARRDCDEEGSNCSPSCSAREISRSLALDQLESRLLHSDAATPGAETAYLEQMSVSSVLRPPPHSKPHSEVTAPSSSLPLLPPDDPAVKTRCTRAAEEASRAAQSAADKARSLADAEHSKAAAVKHAKIEKDRQKKQSKRDRERDTQVKREEENIARTKEFVEAAAIAQARAHDIGSAKAAAERVHEEEVRCQKAGLERKLAVAEAQLVTDAQATSERESVLNDEVKSLSARLQILVGADSASTAAAEAMLEQKAALETKLAGLEERIKGIADHLGANVDDYYLGLDREEAEDEAEAEEEEAEVDALRVQNAALEAKVAGCERRVKCLADHLGANVDEYHLGLDKLAREEEAAKAMILHASSVIFRSESQNLQRAQEAKNVMTVDAVHSLEDHS